MKERTLTLVLFLAFLFGCTRTPEEEGNGKSRKHSRYRKGRRSARDGKPPVADPQRGQPSSPGTSSAGAAPPSKDKDARMVAALTKACAAKNGTACHDLGKHHARGWGVPKDTTVARKYFQMACDLKNGDGCTGLGIYALMGEGVPEDAVQAVKHFRRSCDLGAGSGCIQLSLQVFSGKGGLKKDVKGALGLAHKACRLKDGNGCYMVGAFYSDKTLGMVDSAKATKYYRMACDLKNRHACAQLGL